MTTQMRGYGVEEPAYEQALHAFSGGFMHRGHACGLLTGAVLAAGFAARARFVDDRRRCGAALHAAIHLARAYPALAGAVDCATITEVSLCAPRGRLRYLWRRKDRLCGRLHVEWAPRARRVTDEALAQFEACGATGSCANCAVRTVQTLGSSVGIGGEDAVLVAGFAGGMGLAGNVCGALATGAFAMLAGRRLARDPLGRDSRGRRLLEALAGTGERHGAAAGLRRAFVERFASERCVDVAGRSFPTAAEHHRFVEQGGCEDVVRFVAGWVVKHGAQGAA